MQFSRDILTETEVPLPKTKKPKYYHQNFVDRWLQDPLFKDWLEKRHHNAKQEMRAFCKYCSEYLTNGKTEIKRHGEAKCHIEAGNKYQEKVMQEKQMKSYVSRETKVVEMELRIASFIADNNLPLSLVDNLTDFMRACFPQDETLKLVNMKKQKLGNIIRYGKNTFHIS